jgi:hypothetical protein
MLMTALQEVEFRVVWFLSSLSEYHAQRNRLENGHQYKMQPLRCTLSEIHIPHVYRIDCAGALSSNNFASDLQQ